MKEARYKTVYTTEFHKHNSRKCKLIHRKETGVCLKLRPEEEWTAKESKGSFRGNGNK